MDKTNVVIGLEGTITYASNLVGRGLTSGKANQVLRLLLVLATRVGISFFIRN